MYTVKEHLVVRACLKGKVDNKIIIKFGGGGGGDFDNIFDILNFLTVVWIYLLLHCYEGVHLKLFWQMKGHYLRS